MPEILKSYLFYSFRILQKHPKDVWDALRTSILNVSKKLIPVVIFLVLIHQMCVFDIKKLAIAHSFTFGESF